MAVNGTPSQSYGVSLAIWDHTVLSATRHKKCMVTHPPHSIDLPQRDRRLSCGEWLHTAMVYPPADGHPSKL